MTDDIWTLPASELVEAYRAKRLSPIEATEAALARIDAHNDTINAYLLVDADGARAAARGSEARWAKGEPAGLVDGVPISLKDVLLPRGWPTLRGSKTVHPDPPGAAAAPAAARMRAPAAVAPGRPAGGGAAGRRIACCPIASRRPVRRRRHARGGRLHHPGGRSR